MLTQHERVSRHAARGGAPFIWAVPRASARASARAHALVPDAGDVYADLADDDANDADLDRDDGDRGLRACVSR